MRCPQCTDEDVKTSRNHIFPKARQVGFGINKAISNSHNSQTLMERDLKLEDKDPDPECVRFPLITPLLGFFI